MNQFTLNTRIKSGVLSIATLALALSCFSYFSAPEIGEKAWQVFLVISAAGFLFLKDKRELLAPTLLFALAILSQTLSWLLIRASHPELAETSPKLHRLGASFSVILVIFLLHKRQIAPWQPWLLAIVGGMLAVCTQGQGWAEIQRAVKGARIDYGFSNAQHSAMFFGFALLGLLFSAKRWFATKNLRQLMRTTLLFATLLLTLAILAFTQTRGIMVGLLAATISLIILLPLSRKISTTSSQGPRALAVASIGFAALMIIIVTSTMDRWEKEFSTVESLVSGSLAHPEMDNVGIRVAIWLESAEWVAKRPLTGWGGGIRKQIIQSSPLLSDDVKAHIGHLHNSYLEVAASYGLLGLAAILGLYVWIIKRIRTQWREGALPTNLYYLGLTGMVYWCVVNIFESYLLFSSGQFAFALFFGGILGRGLMAKATS